MRRDDLAVISASVRGRLARRPAAMAAWLCVAMLGAGCPRPVQDGGFGTTAFGRDAERIFQSYLDHEPGTGMGLGLHQYDGRLPDVSAAAIAAEIADFRGYQRILEDYPANRLSAEERLERDTLLLEMRRSLFDLTELRAPWHDPTSYDGELELDRYLSRDYAPLEQRARSIAALARATPAYLAAARANLDPVLPAPLVETALFEIAGDLEFVRGDVRAALAGLGDGPVRHEVETALDAMAAALEEHHRFLEQRRGTADQSHVLGADKLVRMVAATEGFDTTLAEIERIGALHFAADSAALVEAARAIDPARPARDVVNEIFALKPGDVLAEARRQSGEARQFLIERDLVGVPADVPSEVREAPPYLRNATAYLQSAGVFEPAPLPGFFLISPPDPAWSPAEQRAYLPATWDLLVLTTHELYPGHFVDELHRRHLRSRILAASWHELMGEGWAHYSEELMWESGFAGGDPHYHVMQLEEALLRDVRVQCAVGVHAHGMSIDECARRMRDDAYVDDETARQEAMRAAWDPMYLSYTLGKHLIRGLRDEWRAKMGSEFSLRAFHDRFLACGGAPFPSIRRAMLEDGGGSS